MKKMNKFLLIYFQIKKLLKLTFKVIQDHNLCAYKIIKLKQNMIDIILNNITFL